MNLYLARHGESILNAQKVHQFPETPLSELGRQQAQFLARRVDSLPIDVILSSPFTRALQTAQTVAAVHPSNPEVVTSPLLQEIARPSEILGKSVLDPETVKIKDAMYDHYHEMEWRHSDEENFALSSERARRCLQMITTRPEDNVFCVSHGLFLALLISTMLFEEELTSQVYLRFVEHVYTKNTGLTWCRYEKGQWQLVTWNDHAHLAE